MELGYRYIFTILLIVVVNCFVFGQFSKFELRHIAKEHGLPGGSGRQLYQDSKGLMWISIESYGLAKYDGVSYLLFSHDKDDSASICSNVIEELCEDADANIWAGTQVGLSIYNRQTNSFTNIYAKKGSPDHLPGKYVTDLEAVGNGDIWVATRNGAALYSHTTKKFTHYLSDGDQEQRVMDITITPDSTVWFATRGGLWKLEKGEELVSVDLSAYMEYGYNAAVAWGDSLLALASPGFNVCTYNYRTEAVNVMSLPDVEGGGSAGISDVAVDNKNHLWLITPTYGVYVCFSPHGPHEHIMPSVKNPKGLKGQEIRDVYVDRQGVVWLAVKFNGVQSFNYQCETFPHIYRDEDQEGGLRSDYILSLLADSSNKVWVGTLSGLHFFDPETGTVELAKNPEQPELETGYIKSLMQDYDGNVWVGMFNRLCISNQDYTSVKYIKQISATAIVQDYDSTVWIGTFDSLSVFDKGEIVNFNDYSGLNTDLDHLRVDAILADSKGNVWLGTWRNGLYLYDKERNQLHDLNYSKETGKGIDADFIRYIYEDSDKTVWIATKGSGLYKFNWADSSFVNFTEKDGLPIHTLFAITEDGMKNLWIATYQGICKFNTQTYTPENFTREYGLQNDMFTPSVTKDTNGYLYFGGNNGFNWFNPAEVNITKNKCLLCLLQLRYLTSRFILM